MPKVAFFAEEGGYFVFHRLSLEIAAKLPGHDVNATQQLVSIQAQFNLMV